MDNNLELANYKIQAVTEALGDLRERIREIATTVNTINVVDLQTKQNAESIAGLSREYHTLGRQLLEIQGALEQKIDESSSEQNQKRETLATNVSKHSEAVDKKINLASGIVLGFSALSAVISGFLGYEFNKLSSKIESSYEYITTLKALKAEETLRKNLESNVPPNR